MVIEFSRLWGVNVLVERDCYDKKMPTSAKFNNILILVNEQITSPVSHTKINTPKVVLIFTVRLLCALVITYTYYGA